MKGSEVCVCGHAVRRHEIEPLYPCYECDCENYQPQPSATALQEDMSDECPVLKGIPCPSIPCSFCGRGITPEMKAATDKWMADTRTALKEIREAIKYAHREAPIK
jgi:hypothetical protein